MMVSFFILSAFAIAFVSSLLYVATECKHQKALIAFELPQRLDDVCCNDLHNVTELR